MATFDDVIQVSVLTDAAPVGRAGFGVAIVCDAASMAERVRYYTTPAGASADQVAGEITAAQLAHINAAFAQNPRPARVGAGRTSFTDVAQVNTVTVGGTAVSGDYTIPINGVTLRSPRRCPLIRIATSPQGCAAPSTAAPSL
jgi:hypothetical protein